jgi:hypothetical protein
MPEEVVKRITSSPMSKTVPILAKDELLATLDYAFVTQRGYYPDGEFRFVSLQLPFRLPCVLPYFPHIKLSVAIEMSLESAS